MFSTVLQCSIVDALERCVFIDRTIAEPKLQARGCVNSGRGKYGRPELECHTLAASYRNLSLTPEYLYHPMSTNVGEFSFV